MTTIDFDALQASEGPKVTLLGNQDVGSGLVGSGFEDFSAFASVAVEVKAQRRSARSPSVSLTVLVEHSDDGLSWVTAQMFTFVDDGEQSASVSSPKAHLRGSASGTGGDWYLKSLTVSPSYLDAVGGGGGSTPVLHGFAAHWFYGGGSLVADGDKWTFDWPNINVDWDTDGFVDAVNFEIRVPLDPAGLGGIYQARTRYAYSQAAAGGFVGTSVGETAMANTWAPCIFDDGTVQVIEGAKLFNEDDGGNDFDVTNLFNFSGHDVTLHRIDFWAVRLGPQPA